MTFYFFNYAPRISKLLGWSHEQTPLKPPPIANACIFPIQPIKFAVTSYYICQMTVKFSLLLFLYTKMRTLSAWKYFYIYPAYVPVAYGLADVDWKE